MSVIGNIQYVKVVTENDVRLVDPLPIPGPARNFYYHCILTDKQREAIESTMCKIGLKYSVETNPLMFQLCRRRLETQNRGLAREQVYHNQTRSLREIERTALVQLQMTYRARLEELNEQIGNGLAQEINYLTIYQKSLEEIILAIESAQEKVDERQMVFLERQNKLGLNCEKKQPSSGNSFVRKEEEKKSGRSSNEGGSNAPIGEGGEKEDRLTARRREESTSVLEFRKELKKIVAELEREPTTIEDELKSSRLEELEDPEKDLETAPANQLVSQLFSADNKQPIRKRPRILLASKAASTLTPEFLPCYSNGEESPSKTVKVSKRLDTNLSGIVVNVRPSSSTSFLNELKDQEGAVKLPIQRINSIVFRKDYKNPPLPLPADDGTHVLCHLCRNKIMCTRLSNLTNHVKRHSAIKQYQCAQCNYQHNEQAKVRIHLRRAHNDKFSLPVDNLSKDMQKIWSYLMEECFPGYLDQLDQSTPGNCVDWDRQVAKRLEQEEAESTLHSCMECGVAVSIKNSQKQSAVAGPLGGHILENHLDICVPHQCAECGYTHSDEWKVRWHISCRHPEKAAEIQVEKGEMGNCMDSFAYKLFPSIADVIGPRSEDSDEIELNRAMLCPEVEVHSPQGGATATCIIKNETEELGDEELDQLIEKSFDVVPPEKSENRPKKGQVQCKLCNKWLEWVNKSTLTGLLAHAKRHFKIKQYECQQCGYSSSEANNVKNHLQQKHRSQERPIEHNNEAMQRNWLTMMRKCFPSLKDRIDQFKFKGHRQPFVPEGEERRSTPSHSYGTRRKRNFEEDNSN